MAAVASASAVAPRVELLVLLLQNVLLLRLPVCGLLAQFLLDLPFDVFFLEVNSLTLVLVLELLELVDFGKQVVLPSPDLDQLLLDKQALEGHVDLLVDQQVPSVRR